jgi:hypothetical protein
VAARVPLSWETAEKVSSPAENCPGDLPESEGGDRLRLLRALIYGHLIGAVAPGATQAAL